MRSEQTFGIDFIVRACKKERDMALIYAKITIDGGEPAELSIKEKIKHKDWDWVAEKVIGRTQKAKDINDCIDDIRALHKWKGRYDPGIIYRLS